ncbi:MAG: hypothetical protein ACFBZ8_00820 [Opitutales bacterium]
MTPTLTTYFTRRSEAAHLFLGYLALLTACFLLPVLAKAEIERRGAETPQLAEGSKAATSPEANLRP